MLLTAFVHHNYTQDRGIRLFNDHKLALLYINNPRRAEAPRVLL